jgi:hypothetical protein
MIQPSNQPIMAVGNLTVENVVAGDENLTDTLNNGNAGDGILVHGGVAFQTALGNGLTLAAYNQVFPDYTSRFLLGSNNPGLAAAVAVAYDSILPASQANVVIDNSDVSLNGNHGIDFTGFGNQTYLKPFANPLTRVPGSINDFVENQVSSRTPSADGHRIDSDSEGPAVQFNATITNNRIEQNKNNGININLTGQFGDSFDLLTNERTAANNFIISGNLIQRNGQNGIFFQANAASQDFIVVPFIDPQPTNPGAPYIPANIGASDPFDYNAGFAAPDVFLSDYNDMTTKNDTFMTITSNIIQFNGGELPNQGDGIYTRVSTDSYLALDLGGAAGAGTGNTFYGNTLADFHIESFIQYQERPDQPAIQGVPMRVFENPPASQPSAPPPADLIFLDHTAQLDLRFNNNTGSKVSAPFAFGPENAAIYDVLAMQDGAAPSGKGLGARFVQIFEVDDGLNLNANNNWNAQNLSVEFNNGNIHLRQPPPDPLFPNPLFPLNWFNNPGNPFLP